MELIRREFLRSLFVQMDETGFKKGRAGTTGYVWIAVISGAIWAVSAPTRAAAVLQEHFGWLLDKAVVAADGLRAYQVLFRYLQRCWRHLLARAEAEAVTGDAGDGARYERLKRFYRRIKKMKTQDPFITMYLTREIRAIPSTFPDGKPKTHLTRAVPYTFTFLAFRDMPPQNNDAELAIRDNIVVQRNVRHHITTPGGARGVLPPGHVCGHLPQERHVAVQGRNRDDQEPGMGHVPPRPVGGRGLVRIRRSRVRIRGSHRVLDCGDAAAECDRGLTTKVGL